MQAARLATIQQKRPIRISHAPRREHRGKRGSRQTALNEATRPGLCPKRQQYLEEVVEPERLSDLLEQVRARARVREVVDADQPPPVEPVQHVVVDEPSEVWPFVARLGEPLVVGKLHDVVPQRLRAVTGVRKIVCAL